MGDAIAFFGRPVQDDHLRIMLICGFFHPREVVHPPGVHMEMIEIPSAIPNNKHFLMRMPLHRCNKDILNIPFQIGIYPNAINKSPPHYPFAPQMRGPNISSPLFMTGNKMGSTVADMADNDRHDDTGSPSFGKRGNNKQQG